MELVPSFAVINKLHSTSLSIPFWSGAVGICARSAIRALVRSGGDVVQGLGQLSNLAFQFIPWALSEVEVSARHSSSSSPTLPKPCLHRPCFVQMCIIMPEHVWAT